MDEIITHKCVNGRTCSLHGEGVRGIDLGEWERGQQAASVYRERCPGPGQQGFPISRIEFPCGARSRTSQKERICVGGDPSDRDHVSGSLVEGLVFDVRPEQPQGEEGQPLM